jgi:hypothetical protein
MKPPHAAAINNCRITREVYAIDVDPVVGHDGIVAVRDEPWRCLDTPISG